ncbi:MAG: hypothetical protein WC782_10070 [Methylococcaceae bacterium]|jgi:hypothetical protein
MKFTTLGYFLWFGCAAAAAEKNSSETYLLPNSKAFIDACQSEVLQMHPGEILNQRVEHDAKEVLLRYEIKAVNGDEWVVFCDEQTGKVTHGQKIKHD